MIEVCELSKRYENGPLALDRVSYEVSQGEILCLLGANGAGKTTTINILLDFISPTSGYAKINGQDCNKYPLKVKKHVAYVSENVQLYQMFTARQNLTFFAELSGKKRLKSSDYEELIRCVDLPEKSLYTRVRSFSKGMRQKLGIAIALLKGTSVILMDEPTSGLDPKSAREFLELLGTLRKQGKTILMTTHDIFRAKIIADRVGIMKEGRLVAMYPREEFEHANLEQVYISKMEG